MFYRAMSKLPFTSSSLGGSCYAKHSSSIGDVLKSWASFISGRVKRRSPKTWKSIGAALTQKPRENKQVMLMPPKGFYRVSIVPYRVT